MKPDFVFPRLQVAVFVDGCFWHGCPKHATQPKTNRAFWRKKIARNRQRDREVGRALRRMGWRVVRVWEHGLRRKDEARTVRRLKNYLNPGCEQPGSKRVGTSYSPAQDAKPGQDG